MSSRKRKVKRIQIRLPSSGNISMSLTISYFLTQLFSQLKLWKAKMLEILWLKSTSFSILTSSLKTLIWGPKIQLMLWRTLLITHSRMASLTSLHKTVMKSWTMLSKWITQLRTPPVTRQFQARCRTLSQRPPTLAKILSSKFRGRMPQPLPQGQTFLRNWSSRSRSQNFKKWSRRLSLSLRVSKHSKFSLSAKKRCQTSYLRLSY